MIPFIKARWFTDLTGQLDRGRWVICLHSMESPEKGTTAEAVARYFQTIDRKASAHFNIDNNSIVQCVQTRDVAYAAPGMNRHGIHLEHAGYARQTKAEWLDAYGVDMLTLSATLCAKVLCPKFDIPARWLTLAELRAIRGGQDIRGFTTHADCTAAFATPGGHTDPGKFFPRQEYMDLVKSML